MSLSQTMNFGENTLQELDRVAVLQTVKVSTPNRSSAINSDSDIIEESPTNHSSIRERKHFNKSKTLNKKKKGKSRSSDHLPSVHLTTSTVSQSSKSSLSQFLRSEYDFGDEILKILPGNMSKTNTKVNICDNGQAGEGEAPVNENVQNVSVYETDMFFSQWVVPQNDQLPPKPSQTTAVDRKDNSTRSIWEDSYAFNDIDLNFSFEIPEKNDKKQIEIDDEIAIDNVSFTQNIMNEDLHEEVASKSIEEELESFKNSFSQCPEQQSILRSSQMSTSNVNVSGSSFTLNYSDSSMDIEEKSASTENVNEKSNRESLKHDNSIDSWGLPQSIVREYHRKNIYQMFDWQRECLSNGNVLLHNSNLVYCAPTSAGKTLVSEILMIKNVIEKKKKVLIILPFVSVVREKMNYLQDLLTSTGIQVEGYFGGYSPRSFDTVDVAVCTIEKANSIVNKLLEQKKIATVGCIVVDEVHMISDPGRGYILELLLAKMLYVNQQYQFNIQIIAMSATLPNLDLLTKWLQAEYYHTEYRPVELKEMLKIDKQIFDNEMRLLRTVSDQDYKISPTIPNDPDNIGQMCVETILEGGSVIVFCPSKDWCGSLAMHLAKFIYFIGQTVTEIGGKLLEQIKPSSTEETKAQLRNCPTGLDADLGRTLSYGCAFHHAGLTTDERDIIETSFKSGAIRIIVSTSTLSSGVNLPARRVIIRSPLALGRMLSPLTYKQMIGRAGRTGKDSKGESILICDSKNKRSGQDLISSKLKPLASCLAANNYVHLKRAILEINASGMATSKAELIAFCQCTLLSTEKQSQYECEIQESDLIASHTPSVGEDTSNPIAICLRYLLKNEFIRLQKNDSTKENNFLATRLGAACLASSLPPRQGLVLHAELQKARESFVLETDLHAIYLVTPLSYDVNHIDWNCFLDLWEKLPKSMQRVGELLGVTEASLVKAVRGRTPDTNSLEIHKRFYTALALEELVSEKNINDVAHKFKFVRGQLQSLQQLASASAAVVASFCNALNWTMTADIIAKFKERLFFGVHHDLVDLMKIPTLNSKRARALFDEGIQTLSDLANSKPFDIEKILYNSICFDTKQRDGENEWDAEQRNKLRYLYVTGKPGLTVREAADEMIENARRYLELEMGVENIVWSKNPKRTESENSENQIASQSTTSTQRSNKLTSVQIQRKRKLDDSGETDSLECLVRAKHRFDNKKFRRTQSESESETDSDTDNDELLNDGLAYTRMNSAESNLNGDDQEELIENVIKYEQCRMIHMINVFEKFDYFKKFEAMVKNSTVVSISVGVNQLLKRPPIIGLSAMVKQLNENDETSESYNCAFDDDKFVAGVSLCLSDSVAFYLNLQKEASDDAAITFDVKAKFLVDLFHMEQMTVVMYDAKEQCKVLLKCFPRLRTFSCQLRDPLVANWLLQPEVYGNLLTMIRQYSPYCSGIEYIPGIDSVNRRSISLNCRSAVSPKMRSSVECVATFHIMNSQMEQLNSKMSTAFTDMEMPIQRVLLNMELTGFPVDDRKISEMATELTDTLKSLEDLMFRKHGRRFNIKSKVDKAMVLGLKATNGKLSTSKRVLEKLTHPIAELLLQHKTVHSTLTTIIQPFIRQTVNNRIYPRSSCFSSTGRVHLYEPSLQNITNNFDVSSGAGRKTISCRRVFQPCAGNELISADFCQLELRIITHFSHDQNLSEIMRTNCDVFKVIAAKWNSISEAEVTDKQRNDSKQICYGIIYGMGVRTLAEKMDCDEATAQEQQDLFLKCFPGIRMFTDSVISRARGCGYIETLSGRKRYLPNLTSVDSSKRAKAERQAVNSTIQGSAADIAKLAMLQMDKCLGQPRTWENVNLVLHVHDELVYEAPTASVDDVVWKLKRSMENCYSLNVPLRVKVKVGRDWGTMEAIDC